MKNKITILAMMTFLSGTAMAETATNLPVTAEIEKACILKINTNLIFTFNIIPIRGREEERSESFNVQCTNGTAYNILLSLGNNNSYSEYGPMRAMTSPDSSDKLYYNVSDWNLVQISDGSRNYESAFPISNIGNGKMQWNNLRVRLNPNQFVKPGIYSDTLIMTLEY